MSSINWNYFVSDQRSNTARSQSYVRLLMMRSWCKRSQFMHSIWMLQSTRWKDIKLVTANDPVDNCRRFYEINIYCHDRTISPLRNSGGFGLIHNQIISDAVLDYNVHMRESRRCIESSRTNHQVNSEILHNRKLFELYKIEHLNQRLDSLIREEYFQH